MKRLLLFLASTLFFAIPIASQARLGNFSQQGNATQELKADGLTAAHPSLPLNSKVKVTNIRNGKEVEVSIIDRIPMSTNRILDLSLAALNALDMKSGETVILTVAAPPPPVRGQAEGPIVELTEPTISINLPVEITQTESEKELIVTAKTGETTDVKTDIVTVPKTQSRNMFMNRYFDDTGEFDDLYLDSDNDTDFLAWLMTMTMDARDSREVRELREAREARDIREGRDARDSRDGRETREIREIREAREAREAREKESAIYLTQSVPPQTRAVTGVDAKPMAGEAVHLPQIIPALPDRNSGKIYRLQVGAFLAAETAAKAAKLAENAGFNVEQEDLSSIHRVVVTGIASSDVYSVALKLGSLGFEQVWVRE
ncbi:MAG: septal ring lytic transglycosylase RlpA family protein [Treponema sp.]|nr:septal ring lytic transglycosylase RlpA family protein [Treponema sp.]